MKPNHMGIHVVVPVEKVRQMARLNGGNRTTTVNLAISAYLEVQGPARNRYGVDADYFRRKLKQVLRDIDSYTPEELERTLRYLAGTAHTTDHREALNEEV